MSAALTSRASLTQMSVALRRPSWFHLKLRDVQLPRFISSFMMYNCLAENKTNLSQRSCQTVKNGRVHDWLPVNDTRRAWLFLRGYDLITCR